MSAVLSRRLDRLEQRADASCVHFEIVHFGEGALPEPVPCRHCDGTAVSFVRQADLESVGNEH